MTGEKPMRCVLSLNRPGPTAPSLKLPLSSARARRSTCPLLSRSETTAPGTGPPTSLRTEPRTLCAVTTPEHARAPLPTSIASCRNARCRTHCRSRSAMRGCRCSFVRRRDGGAVVERAHHHWGIGSGKQSHTIGVPRRLGYLAGHSIRKRFLNHARPLRIRPRRLQEPTVHQDRRGPDQSQ